MPVDVKTPLFQGPFDLLLHLILSEQVDLYEISLNDIVDKFLQEIEQLENLDLDASTEFLLIAATLVELKARRLLPGVGDGDLDDELALWEERDLLLARLLECKTFKDAASVLAERLSDASKHFARRVGPDERFVDLTPDALAGVTVEKLRAAFVNAASPKPTPKVDLHHVAAIQASVTDAIEELADELSRTGGPISFRALTESFVERIEIVVRFLAVLELFKQGLVDLDQPSNFGEISILWTGGVDHHGTANIELVDVYDG